MTDSKPAIRTITLSRDFAHPPERLWRALTQPALMREWLMEADFAPIEGRALKLTGDWGSVEGSVLEVNEPHRLTYSWNAMGLNSTVTFTLTPSEAGTLLTMEQTGFTPEQDQAYYGASHGWQAMLDKLGQVLARPLQ